MKYVAQRNLYSCGPIAIINALKWAGQNVTYKKYYKKLIRKTKCTYSGTHDLNISVALFDYVNSFNKIEWLVEPTIKDINKHLSSGGAAIISYDLLSNEVKERECHFLLVVKKEKEYYHVVNGTQGGKAFEKWHKSIINMRLKAAQSAWLLERKIIS